MLFYTGYTLTLCSQPMNNQEFEAYYREQVREVLNQLQAAALVSARLEGSLTDIGQSIQRLGRDVERFLSEQGNTDSPPSGI